MLKLGRDSSRQVGVIIQDRERHFTPALLTGFCVAVAFHLLFITLFQVSPFKIRSYSTVLFPAYVEINPVNDSVVIANVEEFKEIMHGLPPAIFSEPILSHIPAFAPVRTMKYSMEDRVSENPFSKVEQEIYFPKITALAKKVSDPFQIIVSGPLGRLSHQFDGMTKPLPMLDHEVLMIYKVLVEGRSGKIFWYELKQPIRQRQLDRYATELLHHLQFAKESQKFVIEGEVEMHFHLSSR